MIRTLALAALAAALVVPTAHAQQATAAKAPVNDSMFASAAASGGLAELTLSELGLQKATDPELKKFSQTMIDEHSRVNQELTTLAAQKRLPLPRAADARAQFCAQSLAGLSGEEFDRCYAKAQLVTHMDAYGMYEAEAERGQDRDLKAFASKTLPHIKDHLKMIRPLARKFEKEHSDDARSDSERHSGSEKRSDSERRSK